MSNKEYFNKQLLLTMLAAALVSLLAFNVAAASPLTQPKTDGWIGEQADGYLGLVREDAPADIRKLVTEVNAKRKAGYQSIASKQGLALSDVEKVGGKHAIEKTEPGNYIRESNGSWKKK